jgi:threonine/homoserine/homoserine lactone efflux protein
MTEALLALIVDLSIAGAIFLIWFLYKRSKTPEPEEKTKTTETPTTPAPEKEFPVGAIIGVIAVFIVITAIVLLASNSSEFQ